ncbi:MAG: DUF1540 domain-containing protein [Clostridia bacterium]|nr:DUF1540 domain-containing protein [Clostridia bacterium]MBQ2237686.1 DUF1540 domain-containing protein [Clostridia bacterium]MEE1185350.1 DUF1540 domain-containing protein [Acutalibacteraceae bacterium]
MADCKCDTASCVACSVKSCVYHAENDMCMAGKIQVGNRTAQTESETYCDTYKNK